VRYPALCAALFLAGGVLRTGGGSDEPPLSLGPWRAWLESPGGELPFGLELAQDGDALAAWILNGTERIPVPEARREGPDLVLDITHYDSVLRARIGEDGKRLDGEWRKRVSTDGFCVLPFRAHAGSAARFLPAPAPRPGAASLAPRWSVRFASETDPAVLLADVHDTAATGTFLTTTGDYRYLAGDFDGEQLRLSCFDGAHAFLFRARLGQDGSLAGDFWSRDSWHDTWTALPDASAQLPDALSLTRALADVDWSQLRYPDLDGHLRSLDEKEFQGKARILYLFGSWCPNCQDATATLVDLDRRYRPRGLAIVGLAFELTDDAAHNVRQVREYARRHGVTWPLLLAGPADKARASEAFPALDRVRSYPTTLFLTASGEVRAVYTGFSGPATGAAYTELCSRYETLIEELLADSP